MKLVEQYLKSLNAPPPQKQIGYNDPKKFQFKPPGTTDAKKYVKGAPAKFERKPPGVKEDVGAQFASAAGMASGVIVAGLIAWAHKKYMDFYGKANEACGNERTRR